MERFLLPKEVQIVIEKLRIDHNTKESNSKFLGCKWIKLSQPS
jgi:hypothetical protein